MMTNQKITNDYFLNTSKFTYTDKKDNSSLGKDAFLQILITQLQNQDPTSPMDDKEFIAQMAQFSSLEQMQNMTKAMESLLQSQQQTQLMSYTNFIGKEIKWHEITDKVDNEGKNIIEEGKGVITELKFKDDQPVFVLDTGKEVSAGNISSILTGGTVVTSNPFAEASQLIGKTVQYKNAEGQTVQSIIDAITQKNNVLEYILKDQTRLARDGFELLATDEEK
jgi:flagellar basal-body rod modification protein FlgD